MPKKANLHSLCMQWAFATFIIHYLSHSLLICSARPSTFCVFTFPYCQNDISFFCAFCLEWGFLELCLVVMYACSFLYYTYLLTLFLLGERAFLFATYFFPLSYSLLLLMQRVLYAMRSHYHQPRKWNDSHYYYIIMQEATTARLIASESSASFNRYIHTNIAYFSTTSLQVIRYQRFCCSDLHSPLSVYFSASLPNLYFYLS